MEGRGSHGCSLEAGNWIELGTISRPQLALTAPLWCDLNNVLLRMLRLRPWSVGWQTGARRQSKQMAHSCELAHPRCACCEWGQETHGVSSSYGNSRRVVGVDSKVAIKR